MAGASERAGRSGEGDPSGSPRWDLLLLFLVGGHLVWLFSHFLPIVVGPDAGGLFVQARLLATEFSTGFRPGSPLQFLGSHWIETADGDFHSRFPPGYPLLLAIAHVLGGSRAPFYLNPILASSVVGLTYLVGRRWLGRATAFLGALLVAVLPILNRLALHGDAHVAAAALLLLGVWFLFRWEASPTASRAFLAGLAFGLLPSIRYPEAVVGVGVLAFFLAQDPSTRWRRGLVPAALGAGLPFILLGLYNTFAYGSPLQTGYGFTNEQLAFSTTYLAANVPTYLGAIATGGAGLLVLLGEAGLVWMVVRKETRPKGLLFLGTALSLTLLYSSYYWGAQEEAGLTLRYFLATLPLLFLGAIWLLQRIPDRRLSALALALLSVIYLARALPESSESLLEEWVGVARGQAVSVAVLNAVPPGSILVARREVQDMLDYFGQWRLVDDRMLPGTPGRREATLVWELSDEERAGLAGIPTPVQISKAVEARARYVGQSDLELARLVLEDMEDWAGPETGVFWLGKPETVEAFGRLAGQGLRIRPLGEVPMPGWGGATLLPPWVPKAPLVLFRLETE